MACQTERLLRHSTENSQGKKLRLLSKELPDKQWMDVTLVSFRNAIAQFNNSIDTARPVT